MKHWIGCEEVPSIAKTILFIPLNPLLKGNTSQWKDNQINKK